MQSLRLITMVGLSSRLSPCTCSVLLWYTSFDLLAIGADIRKATIGGGGKGGGFGSLVTGV